MKTVAMRQLCGANRVHLRGERGRAIKRWRRKPPVMTACFAEAGLSVETKVLHATLCNMLKVDILNQKVASVVVIWCSRLRV